MLNPDAANDQYAVLGLHLAAHIAAECATTALDIPRCQRGGKGAL